MVSITGLASQPKDRNFQKAVNTKVKPTPEDVAKARTEFTGINSKLIELFSSIVDSKNYYLIGVDEDLNDLYNLKEFYYYSIEFIKKGDSLYKVDSNLKGAKDDVEYLKDFEIKSLVDQHGKAPLMENC